MQTRVSNSLAVCLAFSLSLSAAARAAGESEAAQGAQGAQSTATGTEAGHMGVHGGMYKGEHEMSGKVTEIDRDKGLVSVETDEGTLKLHFPPSDAQTLNEGDQITIHLGFSKAQGALGTESSGAKTNP